MAMESVNPQNSEPALNLPPHSCERISRTAVVLDSGTQIAAVDHVENSMCKMSMVVVVILGAGLVGLACTDGSGLNPRGSTGGAGGEAKGGQSGGGVTGGSGGMIGVGGVEAGGTGGTTGSGGMTGAGAMVSTGGTKSTGGTTAAGGSSGSGGVASSGGTTTTGGTNRTGGTSATGGTNASGGTTGAGGVTSSDGNRTAGGTIGTGGTSATGGTNASGGTNGTGTGCTPGWTLCCGQCLSPSAGLCGPCLASGGASATGGTPSSGGIGSGGNGSGKVPLQHRSTSASCPSQRGPGPSCVDTPCSSCSSDSQCTDGVNGRCFPWEGLVSQGGCSYDECFTDSNCGARTPCLCRSSSTDNSANMCDIGGNCAVDSDCGPGGYCSPSMETCYSTNPEAEVEGRNYGGPNPYYCHTASDLCINDSDCAPVDAGTVANPLTYTPCAYNVQNTRWECTQFTCGLP